MADPDDPQGTSGDKSSGIGVRIQRADVSDAKEILALQKLAYRSEGEIYNDFHIPPLTQTLEELMADLRRQVFLTAKDENGRVVGSVRAFSKDGTCFIGRLIVHPDLQRHGIGTRLMRTIEAQFQGEVGRYELFTGHRSEGNIRLYRRLGYEVSRGERVSDALTLVYMEKLSG
jgi:ribosomal protein S18 acetylase RimI-like enzyme